MAELPTASRTIPITYELLLAALVLEATPKRLTLETSFSKLELTLPPSLEDQRGLLTELIGGITYRTRMSRRGRLYSFQLGRLVPLTLQRLAKQLEAPLAHLQPLLPGPAVGVGASWRQQRQLPLVQPGGRIQATYLDQYQLTALRTVAGVPQVDITVRTSIRLEGTLMGRPFTGGGAGENSLTLDATRGVALRTSGKVWMCSAVMGQTSTNLTRFEQVLVPAAPGSAPSAPARPAPGRPAPAPSPASMTGP